jgi:pilus assembly protein CpaE
MTKFAQALDLEAAAPGGADGHIMPVPRISIQAFCETTDLSQAVVAAGTDRRMAKAHIKAQMGGLAAAVEAYRSSATPNVILVEHNGQGSDLLVGLDALSEVANWSAAASAIT